jgi:ribulose-5-phosphate 4-epimerase/fuculose-1-phosphate aldolase
MSDDPVDGVIKFQLEHISEQLENLMTDEIDAWRSVFKQLGIIGQDEGKYDGYGFGNLSLRTDSGFLISGTQTGAIDRTVLADYAEVIRWNPLTNFVSSRGMVKPSSESLSHAVIYDAQKHVGCVFHVHSPEIWQNATNLNVPATDPDILYGTPEMADAVETIVLHHELPFVLSMGGHEDGIIAYGRNLSETGLVLMQSLVMARK